MNYEEKVSHFFNMIDEKEYETFIFFMQGFCNISNKKFTKAITGFLNSNLHKKVD